MKHSFFLIAAIALVALTAGCNEQKSSTVNYNSGTENNKAISEVMGDLKVSDIIILEGNKPIECRNFRLRIVNVIPGGEVGIHSHENRPALLSIARGEGAEMHAYKHEPVTVKFGEAYKEYNSTVHYAFNLSKTDTLSIITSDLLDDGATCNNHTYAQHTPLIDEMKAKNDSFFVNAPKSAEDETSIPLYSISLQDIKFPQGKAPFQERHLRVRKITLGAGATTGVQDYSNRPTYIMGLRGRLEVKNVSANTTETINPLGTANLVNTVEIEISNTTGQEAVYFIMELWDPADINIL